MRGWRLMAENDDLDRRLKAADRLPSGIAHSAESRAALDEIRVQARSGPRESVRSGGWRFARRGSRRVVVLAAAVGALAIGGVAAAATYLTTYTGKFVTGYNARSIGPGQLLEIGAPNYCRAGLKLSSDISYPSGYEGWRTWVMLQDLAWQKITPSGSCANHDPFSLEEQVTTGALHGFFAHSAFCAWVTDWQAAEGSGNTAEASNAASVIAGALKWPAVVAEDPHPSDMPVPDGSGTDPSSLFGWMIPYQNAVAAGNTSVVSDLLSGTANYASSVGAQECSAYVPPADSDGGTVVANWTRIVANGRASQIASAKATTTGTTSTTAQ